ncbi:MAG: L-seryl-tRNA(Sec) selenium transferase [Gammaproteobacteria bacterium]|nr:L-seryl-tRNA(Sec) selenium transferase [Gammaproteobacteria bacterium]
MSRRQLPSVDRVLNDPSASAVVARWGKRTVKLALREVQDELRRAPDIPAWATRADGYHDAIDDWLRRHVGRGYEPVFNLTGTLVHTNLGRSPLAPELAAHALDAATRPLALEYDLDAGRRGDREGMVAHRLRLLTGAEAATVVNNNAAAVMLVLNTLARDREVPVSRGELIEIGGSFRLPEIMERAGCRLKEVGTTNRTHARDYENAISTGTALMLKVHPSNYRVEGFSSEVAVRNAAEIAHRHALPLCVDAGSGALVDLSRFGLPREPLPGDLLHAGADLVTFSGDKLLGGVQAGIIVGKRNLIDALNANPMKRALRLDKIALVLLDATLKAYEDEATALEQIPLLGTIALPIEELEERARSVAEALAQVAGAQVAVVACQSELGSGALPGEAIESRAVTVAFDSPKRLLAFEQALRQLNPAVVGRIAGGKLILDMRGAAPLDELLVVLEDLA